MGQLGDQAQGIGLLHRYGVLTQPDAVCDECIAAGVHDTVQTSVPAFCEGIFNVPGNGLHGALHVEQSLANSVMFSD